MVNVNFPKIDLNKPIYVKRNIHFTHCLLGPEHFIHNFCKIIKLKILFMLILSDDMNTDLPFRTFCVFKKHT